MSGASRATQDLFDRWLAAKEGVDTAQQRLNSAETELLNATNDLGKHLTPEDAKMGEEFSIWVGQEAGNKVVDVLVTVKVPALTDAGNYGISVRERKRERVP